MINQKRNYFVLGSIITFFVVGGMTLYAKTALYDDESSEHARMVVMDNSVVATDTTLSLLDDGDRNDSHDDEWDDGRYRDDDDEDEEEDEDDDTHRPTAKPNPPVVATPTVTTPAPKTSPAAGTTAGKTFTLSEIATHNTRTSCYTVIAGSVYDLTGYIDKHPGGVQEIMAICGKDGNALFAGKHGGDPKPERALSSLLLGTVTP